VVELAGPFQNSALARSGVDSEWLSERDSVFASTRAVSTVFEKMLDRRLSQCLSERWNRPSFSCRIWLACDQTVSYL